MSVGKNKNILIYIERSVLSRPPTGASRLLSTQASGPIQLLGRRAVGGSKVITVNNADSVDGDDHDGGRLYLPSIGYIVHVLRNAGLAARISCGLLSARHHRDRVDISRPLL